MGKESRWDFPVERRYNFADDMKFGKLGEAITQEFLESIVNGSFEVKTDRYRNGRMVVETEQNPRKTGWVPSGLSVTQAKWWMYVYALDGAFIVVSVDRLKRYIATLDAKRIKVFAGASSNPTRGYLLLPDEVMALLIEPAFDSDVE
jgi:hypothetical protein